MLRCRLVGLAVTVGLLWFDNCYAADQWPQYRGPDGDGTIQTDGQPVDWNTAFQVKWRVPTPNGFSSFSVAGGQCFTLVDPSAKRGTKNPSLVARDATTGEQTWAAALKPTKFKPGGNSGADDNKGGDGPRCTPLYDGGRVYVYDAGMRLYCFDAESGTLLWQQDVGADYEGRKILWASASSPIIVDNKVIVFGGGEDQSLLAFDKTTGELIWRTGDEKPTHATPTVAVIGGRKQVIFFMQSGPIAIDPEDGAELWRTKFEYSISTAASPVVDGNRVYLSAGYGVGALLLDVQTGTGSSPRWSTTDVWYKKGELMNHWSTPVVHDGHLYGIFGFKEYGTAPLQCVELATGKIRWTRPGYGQGNCILIDDKLVVLSDAGELAIVEASPDGYVEIARQKLLTGKCWSTPAFCEGHLYIRSTTEGVCVKL